MNKLKIISHVYSKLPEPAKEAFVSSANKYVINKINKRITPGSLFIYVTDLCDAKCKHCFYWEHLNKKTDILGIEEIKKIVTSLKDPLEKVTLTGGEPFIRRDLDEICKTICDNSPDLKGIAICTNGIATDRIISMTKKILNKIPKHVELFIYVSIDGRKALHEHFRDVKNCFERIEDTIMQFKLLKKKHPNITTSVTTTITSMNYDEIIPLAHYVKDELRVYHNFILVRSINWGVFTPHKDLLMGTFDVKDDGAILPSFEKLEYLYDYLTKNGFLKGRTKSTIRYSIDTLKRKEKLVECLSGRLEGVIYQNGEFSFCELLKPFGNLKDTDFNLYELINSKQGDDRRIKMGQCACIHSCNMNSSLTGDIKARMNEIINN